MREITFDTSGAVTIPSGPYAGVWTWETLPTNFVRGHVEALFASLKLAVAIDNRAIQPRFSDLSPEALALILRDCEAIIAHFKPVLLTRAGGLTAWDRTREGRYISLGAPPRTPYLNDDGKVCLQERPR